MRCAPVLRIVGLVVALASAGHGAALAQAPAEASNAAKVAAAAQDPPSPLEQAVIEHACRVPGQAMLSAQGYDACLAEQLAGLRVEFGHDLKKLSAAERRTIDRACTALRAERGRDAYVACLDQRLTLLVSARGRTRPAVSLVPPTPVPPVEPAAVLPPAAGVPVDQAQGGSSIWVWVGAVLAVMAAAGAFGMWRSRQRPAPALCRVCGELAQAGDLCATCRHELADSQRRAAAERTEQAQTVVQAALLAEESAHARQRDAERLFEAERSREREAAVRADVQRDVPVATPPPVTPPVTPPLQTPEAAGRRREDDHRRWQEAAAATISEPDMATPHAMLGVAADATATEIRAAYEAALAKYAADQVAHLGVELQDHYRRKRDAVEHAFEALCGAAPDNTPALVSAPASSPASSPA